MTQPGMPKRKLIEVAGTAVRLPDGGPAVEPMLKQRCTTLERGFADLESLYDAPPISHEIDVAVSRYPLESADEAAWTRLAALFKVERSEADEWVTIASTQVDEFPARFYWDLKTTWYDWLDPMDGDLAVVGEFADEMMEREDSMGLLSGSLFYIRNVEVHPAFSGQQIGARLVAHALWSLSRSDGDVAMLLARPMTGRFHPGKPDCSAAIHPPVGRLLPQDGLRALPSARAVPRRWRGAHARPQRGIHLAFLWTRRDGERRIKFQMVGVCAPCSGSSFPTATADCVQPCLQ